MLEEAHGSLFQSHSKLSDLWNHTKPEDYKDFNLKNVVKACKDVFNSLTLAQSSFL